MLERQRTLRAAPRALPRAGSRMPMSSAMIAMTTSSSMRVNARRRCMACPPPSGVRAWEARRRTFARRRAVRPWGSLGAAVAEAAEEAGEVVDVDGGVAVEVGGGVLVAEGAEEAEEVVHVDRLVAVEVGGAGGLVLDADEGDAVDLDRER